MPPQLLDVPLQKTLGAVPTESFQDIADNEAQRRASVQVQQIDERQQVITQQTTDVSFSQAFGAAIDTEMSAKAMFDAFNKRGSVLDPDYVYDPAQVDAIGKQFDGDKEAQQVFITESIKAKSKADLELIAYDVAQYRAKQKAITDAGGKGIAASVLAAIADPTNAVFGGLGWAGGAARGLLAGSKVAGKISSIKTAASAGTAAESVVGASRFSKALTGAGAAVATNMPIEAVLQATQPLREIDDAYATFGASAILGAAGGWLAGGQTRSNKLFNEMTNRRALAAEKRVEAYALAGFDNSPKVDDEVAFMSGTTVFRGKAKSFTDDHVVVVDSAGESHVVPTGMLRPATYKQANGLVDGMSPPSVPAEKASLVFQTADEGVPPTVAATLGPYAGQVKANRGKTFSMIKVQNGIPDLDTPSVYTKVDGVDVHPDIDPRPYTSSAASATEVPAMRMFHEMVHGDPQIAQDLIDACARR
jgi:hypothetical protein